MADIKEELITTTTKTGVLILNGCRTFGKKNGKLLYKCIPYKSETPTVLIPYQLKMGFSKNIKNKFISFTVANDTTIETPPIGQLCNVFGDIDDLTAYYEYQLNSRELSFSQIKGNYKTNTTNPDSVIEDRLFEYTFTIDNEGTTDYDDAFSIRKMGGGQWKISVYIINVAFYIEYFQLWETIKERLMSNIYLPHRKINILPTSLIDHFLSLKAGMERYTLCLDITIDENKNVIDTVITQALISVKHNYVYDSVELLGNEHYRNLLANTPITTPINNSHELVAYWMEYYNLNVMKQVPTTLLKSFIYTHHYVIPYTIDNVFLHQLVQSYPNGYYFYSEEGGEGKNDYIHLTSPIRRIVDIWNQSVLSMIAFTPLDLERGNLQIKQIRKLQMETFLMKTCFDFANLETLYDGVLFDVERGVGEYKYSVYVKSLKLVSKIKSVVEYPLFSHYRFKIFLFSSEYQMNRKIKLQLWTAV